MRDYLQVKFDLKNICVDQDFRVRQRTPKIYNADYGYDESTKLEKSALRQPMIENITQHATLDIANIAVHRDNAQCFTGRWSYPH